TLHKMGKYEEGLQLLKHVERKQTRTLGDNHPGLVNTRKNIQIMISSKPAKIFNIWKMFSK
ncbi:tetratricopeptide repeat protein, partial [Acinetobacter baumannii]|uniref:tetratricopeptide repeat protein n=1 Tax=Acinetobacter baumannii TaxID=470 RepID=UPI001C066261